MIKKLDSLKNNIIYHIIVIFVGMGFMTASSLAITLEEALDLALKTNSQIVAARQNYLAQRESITQIAAQKLPSVTANVSTNKVWDLKDNDDVDSLAADLTANYTLFDGNRTIHNLRAEKYRLQRIEVELVGVEQKVLFDAIVAYLNVLKDIRLVELSSKNVVMLKQQLAATTSRYELGEVTLTDVAQATAALEAANSVLVSREGVLTLSKSLFETIVGIKAEELDTKIELPDLPSSLAAAKKLAESSNLSLKAGFLSEKRAKALWEASKSKSLPTVNISSSISGGEATSNSDYSNFGITFRGSIPIYSGGALKSGEREAFSSLEAAMANTVITRLGVIQNVMTAWSDFEVTTAIINARIRQVEATELAHQGILEEARLGARTTLHVLESEQAVMNTKTDLETAMSDRLVAAYRILMEVGTLTPSMIGLTSTVRGEFIGQN